MEVTQVGQPEEPTSHYSFPAADMDLLLSMDHATNLLIGLGGFFISGPLYAIFAGPWGRAHGFNDEKKPPSYPALYLFGLLLKIVLTYFIAYYVSVLKVTTLSGVLYHTAVLGLGFAVTPALSHNTFAHGLSAATVITLVDGLHALLSIFFVMAALVLWK